MQAFIMFYFYSGFGVKTFLGIDIIPLIMFSGLITVVLTKSAKISLFDSTRNMAYRPLDEELKAKGQAAAELLGSKLGKSTSSGINYTLTNLIATGSKVGDHLAIIIPITGVLIFGWVRSIFAINKSYKQLSNKN